MQYICTRGGTPVSAAYAIRHGISDNGGLYTPSDFPILKLSELMPLADDYPQLCAKILSLYLPEFGFETLHIYAKRAYASFSDEAVVPLRQLSPTESILELWHGRTMAFKDVALQLLPYLLTDAQRRVGAAETVYILVATSGDTGKAALSGFCNVEGTRVLVFYPYGGVSAAQRRQMVTQEGDNVDVCAVRGNFDDAQTQVKRLFTDPDLKARLQERGMVLSSANSINLGRLLPQIVYYVSAYLRLVHAGTIQLGEKIDFCVPTGNFGDILAGDYARRMGLPIRRLICASNQNRVLTDFFQTGVYDASRPFYRSMSCSVDILISSNLERLLFEQSGRDAKATSEWMRQLNLTGRYEVPKALRDELSRGFCAGCCSEEQTLAAIRNTFLRSGILIDPHTAVAQQVYEQLDLGDGTHTVLLSTADPFKFSTAVLGAFERTDADDLTNAKRLSTLCGRDLPEALLSLQEKREHFLDVVDADGMQERVLSF